MLSLYDAHSECQLRTQAASFSLSTYVDRFLVNLDFGAFDEDAVRTATKLESVVVSAIEQQ